MSFFISSFKYKVLILTIVSVVILFLLSVILIDNFSKTVILKERGTQYEYLKFNGNNKKVSLLGTSHTFYGQLMNNNDFIHYGAPRTFFLEMYYKTLKLKEYAKGLKVILLEVDDFHFTKFGLFPNMRSKEYEYLYPKDINKQRESFSLDVSDFFYSLNKNVRPIVHKKVLQNFIEKPMNSTSIDNSVSINDKIYPVVFWDTQSYDFRKTNTLSRLKGQLLDVESELSSELISYLEKTIVLAKEMGIEIFFIRNPVTNEYIKYMNKDMEKKINNEIQRLSNKYKIRVLDYKKLYENNQELFRDQDHLNRLGWEKIAKKVFHDLNKFHNIDKQIKKVKIVSNKPIFQNFYAWEGGYGNFIWSKGNSKIFLYNPNETTVSKNISFKMGSLDSRNISILFNGKLVKKQSLRKDSKHSFEKKIILKKGRNTLEFTTSKKPIGVNSNLDLRKMSFSLSEFKIE